MHCHLLTDELQFYLMGKSFVFAFTVGSADGFEVAEEDLKSFMVCLQKARFVF